ncbi:hypothetical protein [Streptomyces noursei]|uniref:hypothetical protein n=1 Tax=Streptomyces noursei TaxID=1971 RepID=UPI002155D410|nr:hypothetical protein [Streptomyces noursei]
MTDMQMAIALNRSEAAVRASRRDLHRNLAAHNRAHLVTRGWQYGLVTADQVIAWLR